MKLGRRAVCQSHSCSIGAPDHVQSCLQTEGWNGRFEPHQGPTVVQSAPERGLKKTLARVIFEQRGITHIA